MTSAARITALARAAEEGPVVPVFVFDPTVLEHASPIRVAWLLEALASLREWYREQGSELVIPRGETSTAVPAIAEEYDAKRRKRAIDTFEPTRGSGS